MGGGSTFFSRAAKPGRVSVQNESRFFQLAYVMLADSKFINAYPPDRLRNQGSLRCQKRSAF